MSQNNFRITGRVINLSGQAIEGLRIEAWDNDLFINDLVGSAMTDEGGRFQISFDESYFKELFLDRHPDLFFRIFLGDSLIKDTKDNILWNIGMGTDDSAHIVIEVDLDPDMVEMPYVVQGRVTDESGGGVSGAVIRVYDRDMRHEQFIKEAASGINGYYRISYTKEMFQKAEKRNADLIIRVYDPNDPDLLIGESELVYNVAHSETIDVKVGRHLSEYERYLQMIDPVREDVPVGELTEADITFLTNETGIPIQRIEFLVGADHQCQETQIDAAVFYGLARQGLPVELHELIARNFWEIRQTLIKCLDTFVIPESLRSELDQIIEQLKTFAEDPVEVSPFHQIEVQKTHLGQIASMVQLEPAKVELLQTRFNNLVALNDKVLKSLVESQDLDENEAKELGLTASLYHLVDGNVELVEALQNHDFPQIEGGRIQKIRDFIQVTRQDWLEILNGADVTPRADKTIEQYAAYFSRKIENLFPTDVLVERFTSGGPQYLSNNIEKAQPPLKKNRIDLLSRLHQNNPDKELLFLDYSHESEDVEALNFNGLSDEEKAMVQEAVKACQRIYTLTKDIDHTQAILAAGYQSSSDIIKERKSGFHTNTGLDVQTSDRYYNQALEAVGSTAATVATLVDGLWGGFDWTEVGNIGPFIEDYFKSIDGYDELFGSQNFCRCEHCQSILSPSAYFVDLMHFIETSVIPEAFHETHQEHVLYLKVRRPDLWELPMTCENTHTEISQLIIVNEIFENYIARRYEYVGSLEDRNAVEEVVYRQCLQNSNASFQQPFTLPLEKLQIYLSHFGRSRWGIAQLLEEAEHVRTATCLGLTEISYGLVTQAENGLTHLRKLYDIDFEVQADSRTIAAFDAQWLIGPMHLDRDQLGRLIRTSFVSANGNEPVEIVGEKTDDESVQNDIERIYGLTTDTLDRMHRFTRLWDRLRWSIRELDLVLLHFEIQGMSTGIEEATLAHLADLLSLQQRFEITVEQLCTLWSDLPTIPVTDDNASLFDRLFNQAGYPKLDVDAPVDFAHPAFGNDPDENLYRLLGGLRVGDEQLGLLILHLKEALGAVDDSNRFSLSLANLTLLYRHARLAEWLKLSISELFQLIRLTDDISAVHVSSLDDLKALLAVFDWWQSTSYTLDEIEYLIQGIGADSEDSVTSEALVQQLLERITSEHALIFADTVFSYLEGVTETQSRAIITANAEFFEPVGESEQLYWLSETFDPDATLILPNGVELDEDEIKSNISAYHASSVIPTHLAAFTNTSPEQSRSLIAFSGADLNDPIYTGILHGDADTDALKAVIEKFIFLSVLFKPDRFKVEMVDFANNHRDVFGDINLDVVTMQSVILVGLYDSIVQDMADSVDINRLNELLLSFDSNEAQEVLSEILEMESAAIGQLRNHITLPENPLQALDKLRRCVEVVKSSGIGGEALPLIVSWDYDDLEKASHAISAAFRAKYQDENQWQTKVAPFEEKILNRKRDGLSDYLVHAIHPEFNSLSDLYYYFLIDAEVDGCFKTSRIVAANSSLQLYVHRILMNLEQDAAGNFHLKPEWVPRHEWEWRKHYRVWEANRKVFLWPENYILPDLRGNKTPLFEALESELLQQKIDPQTVLDAYGAYIQGFEEVADLKIAGSYHDIREETDTLHLFGVTASDPPSYYYRTVDNAHHGAKTDNRGTVWHPWKEMDVKIPVRKVAPIIYDGKLYVFWVEIVTSSQNAVSSGSSRFIGYKHKLSLKYASLRLDGRWTVPQRISLYGPYPFQESDGVVDDPLADITEQVDYFEALILQGLGIFSEDLGDLEAADRALHTPRYDNKVHSKAIDGYTLSGFEWDQIYPDPGKLIYGAGYQLLTRMDLFNKNIDGIEDGAWWIFGPITLNRIRLAPGPIPDVVLCGKEDKLYFGNGGYGCFGSYAYCTAILDETRIDKITDGWPEEGMSTIRALKNNLYTAPIANTGSQDNVSVINGSLQDAIIDSDGDLLILQGSVREGAKYLLRRFGTTLGREVSKSLFSKGVDGLLDLETQNELNEASNPIEPEPLGSFIEDAVNAGTLDFSGPYGVYYREIFFHIPFLIAHHLNSQGKYAEAQRWYHYIFNPTSSELIGDDPDKSEEENAARKKDRNWRYREFRGHDVATLRAKLSDQSAIETYKRDPFNPHAIARLRLGAYQKCIVMRYIDNLLDWADDLFAQFQMETVNEATMLYVMAADILGPRPAELGACSEGEAAGRTYENVRFDMEEGSEFFVEMEHWSRIKGSIESKNKITHTCDYTVDSLYFGSDSEWQYALTSSEMALIDAESHTGIHRGVTRTAHASTAPQPRTAMTMWPFSDSAYSSNQWQAAAELETNRFAQAEFGWSLVGQLKTAFCVPQNKTLLDYWDRVEDRLFKIRNCMDITGARRQLSLFAPEIDPGLLVGAKAAGISLDDVLDSITGHLPPYRFNYLIAKAMNYAGTVQSLGNALLSALEKKDTEELTLLRSNHEQNILKLTTKAKEWEIDAARETLESLEAQRTTIENRRDYYQNLNSEGLTDWERTQQVTRHIASSIRGGEATLGFLSGALHLIPQVGSPFAMKYGGVETGFSARSFAVGTRALADLADQISASAGLEAGFQRRSQGWRRQVDQANDELVQVEKQIEAANIRLAIAERSLEIHAKNQEQIEEIDAFYKEKFTELGLYNWLSTALQQLYRQAYSSAYNMARLTEQAFRFERDDAPDGLLSHNYWDATRAGLLAGGRLLSDLQEMERKYIENDYRQLEIHQSFSLSQIAPGELIRLRETGNCTFFIDEIFFNLLYPGHYRRRIKAVRLSIPCVAGPYTNVSAKLTLDDSKIRMQPNMDDDPVTVPPTRTISIATSTAQNDAGVFELNFRDERYMPFEGAGAISEWELSLPKHFRQFDYQTISDVVVHMSYTAKEDGAFRETVEGQNAVVESAIYETLSSAENALPYIGSFRYDFSNEWHRFLVSPEAQGILTFELSLNHFPFMFVDKAFEFTRAEFYMRLKDGYDQVDQFPSSFTIQQTGDAQPALSGIFVIQDAPISGLPYALINENFSGTPGNWIFTVPEQELDKLEAVDDILFIFHYKLV